MLGFKLSEAGYQEGLVEPPPFVTVKAPVFSFEKLGAVDVFLGPEMKSTGEVLGIDTDYPKALYKAILASGAVVPESGSILATLADKDKEEGAAILEAFYELGYRFLATDGTADLLEGIGVPVERVYKMGDGRPDVLDVIKGGKVDLLLNTPTREDPQAKRVSDAPGGRRVSGAGAHLPRQRQRVAGSAQDAARGEELSLAAARCSTCSRWDAGRGSPFRSKEACSMRNCAVLAS